MSDFSNMPVNWAGEQALTEAEAFERAVKSSKIIKTDFVVYEQAYRQGRLDQAKETAAEITNLRNKIKEQNDRINKLTETIQRGSEK